MAFFHGQLEVSHASSVKKSLTVSFLFSSDSFLGGGWKGTDTKVVVLLTC